LFSTRLFVQNKFINAKNRLPNYNLVLLINIKSFETWHNWPYHIVLKFLTYTYIIQIVLTLFVIIMYVQICLSNNINTSTQYITLQGLKIQCALQYIYYLWSTYIKISNTKFANVLITLFFRSFKLNYSNLFSLNCSKTMYWSEKLFSKRAQCIFIKIRWFRWLNILFAILTKLVENVFY